MTDARTELLDLLPKNSVGAEIGVHKGDFSARILDIVNPKKLYLIDPWLCFDEDTYDNSWYGKTTAQKELDNRYESVKNKFSTNNNVSILRKLSYNAANDIPDNSLDFVYIDGDHTFKGVCADFDAFYPKVKKGGYICGDDYTNKSWWGSGVIDAVEHNLNTKAIKLHSIIKSQYCCIKLK